MFEIFTQIVNDGLKPCLDMYIRFLLSEEGLILGLGIIVLPLLARIVYIIKKLF